MSGLSQWILAVCIAAVAGGLLKMLLPPGSMERAMRWVLCIFTLSCLLLPLFQTNGWEIDFTSLEAAGEPDTALSERVEEQTARLVERRLLEQTQRQVEACGAKLVKFSLKMDSAGESGIDISQVEVVLRPDDAEKCDAVRLRLEDNLGLAADVSTG